MNSISEKANQIKVRKPENNSKDLDSSSSRNINSNKSEVESFCDENLTTLEKIHAILKNCSNLSKKQKLEFCESERYFMKLYLKKVLKQNQED